MRLYVSNSTEKEKEMTEIVKAGTYTIDPTHSEVGFSVKHLMISKVRGKFNSFGGTITTDDSGIDGVKIQASIDVASVDTNQSDRDNHLRTGDFFDAEHYPTIDFVSTKVEHVSGDKYLIHGDITIKGVTKSIVLDAEFGGEAVDGYGQHKIAGEAHASVKREDFGLTWNTPLENGGVLLGSNVTISLDIQAALNA